MRYEVKLTAQAIGQIEETVQYISKILQSAIKKLDAAPSRYPLTEEEPWHTKGIRRMPVQNFLVYYLVDEEEKAVWIAAVIYARRDRISALLDMPLNETEQ